MKKNTLKTKPQFKGKILGISTSVPGYRLCYFLNKQLELDFQRWKGVKNEAPEEGQDEENQKESPFFWAQPKEESNRFFLLPNKLKSKGEFLLPRYKQIDFIFVIEDREENKDVNHYLEKLRAIQVIQAAFELGNDQFKPEKFLNLD